MAWRGYTGSRQGYSQTYEGCIVLLVIGSKGEFWIWAFQSMKGQATGDQAQVYTRKNNQVEGNQAQASGREFTASRRCWWEAESFLHRQKPKPAAKPNETQEPRSKIAVLSLAFITLSVGAGQGCATCWEPRGGKGFWESHSQMLDFLYLAGTSDLGKSKTSNFYLKGDMDRLGNVQCYRRKGGVRRHSRLSKRSYIYNGN